MEPRQDPERHVVVAHADVDALQLAIRDQIPVGDLGRLGGPGGAGGVLQQSGVAQRARDLFLQLVSGAQHVEQRVGARQRLAALALQE